MKRLILAAALLLCAAPAFAAEDVSALLKRQTQEFSDAGQVGNAAVMAKYLDDAVVFVNEGGDFSLTKHDIVSGVTPSKPQPGVTRSIQVTEWHVAVHGPVAVATFVDSLTQNVHGQITNPKFRSVETWLKEPDGWKMIASQTLALQQDPKAVALPAKTLAEYAGTYQLADTRYVIALKNGALTGTTQGKTVSLKVEAADVLFTPGAPRSRKIFQRDAHGAITGFVNRREGYDLLLKRVG